jgi:transglutaminase/protease-like cytokinesis protein 3
LNEAESAYLAYKWISQNIEYDYNDEKQGNSTKEIAKVYKTGKGGVIGITGLYKTMRDRLKIKADTILGLTKASSGGIKIKIITKEYSWNYILINNKYYLIDVVMSIDFGKNKKRDSDFYFGMDPEASIRLHFPNDNKWQLLPKIITKEEFKSMAYLDEGFFSLGLKTISPDIQSFNNSKTYRIRITSDNSFDEIFDQLEIHFFAEKKGELPEVGIYLKFDKISNGIYEFNYSLYDNGFVDIYFENTKTKETFSLVCFDRV